MNDIEDAWSSYCNDEKINNNSDILSDKINERDNHSKEPTISSDKSK